jgi:hypothetical protein
LFFGCGPVGAGRAHAAEPQIDTAPRPLKALQSRALLSYSLLDEAKVMSA